MTKNDTLPKPTFTIRRDRTEQTNRLNCISLVWDTYGIDAAEDIADHTLIGDWREYAEKYVILEEPDGDTPASVYFGGDGKARTPQTPAAGGDTRSPKEGSDNSKAGTHGLAKEIR